MNRRTEILRRAAEVFARQGVAQTSMEDIARAVGIKREGVYYYFRNRGDILLEIILPQSNSLLKNLQNIVQSNRTSGEKLRAAIESHLDAYNPSYLEMSVALRENHFVDDHRKLDDLKTVWDTYGGLWVALIEEGQAAGQLRREIDAKLAAFGLLGMCNWVSRWYDPHGEVPIHKVAESFFLMASTGLTVPDADIITPTME